MPVTFLKNDRSNPNFLLKKYVCLLAKDIDCVPVTVIINKLQTYIACASSCFLQPDVKLQLHDAIYRLRFYPNSLIHILSLSNSHNNVASLQKNRGDKSHRVIVALTYYRKKDSIKVTGDSFIIHKLEHH